MFPLHHFHAKRYNQYKSQTLIQILMNKINFKINFKLLSRIVETPSAPGFENPIRNLIRDEIKNICR